MSRRIVLVGNAPNEIDIADRVDAADTVIRFNAARGFGTLSGTRTDQLWLINHGGQMAEWLDHDELVHQPAVRAAAFIVLPIPMLPGHLSRAQATPGVVDPDRVNHRDAARDRLERAGLRVRTLDVAAYRAAQRALHTGRPAHAACEHFPSTGFIALHQTLHQAQGDDRIELAGFTFNGWPGHSWAAERDWVETKIAQGRLSMHPVPHERGEPHQPVAEQAITACEARRNRPPG